MDNDSAKHAALRPRLQVYNDQREAEWVMVLRFLVGCITGLFCAVGLSLTFFARKR